MNAADKLPSTEGRLNWQPEALGLNNIFKGANIKTEIAAQHHNGLLCFLVLILIALF